MKTTLTSAVVFLVCVSAVAAQDQAAIYESSVSPTAQHPIDKIVFEKLESLGIQPVLCSDAVFVRRAYLDVIGVLPTAEEARSFIQDTDKQKREKLIDTLLARDEFADYWSMKWGDVLRIKAEFPINLWPNAAQAYHHWVRASVSENKPYDQFAREMLSSSGSNFRVGPVNFYRAVQNKTPEGVATAVALTFMGARMESWPAAWQQATTACFSQIGYKPTREWKEECVFWDPYGTSVAVPEGEEPPPPAVAQSQEVVLPDGQHLVIGSDRDPRELFADWLITPDNPWFTRSIVNRVWAWLLGRGIVHEPDDIRDDNPPSIPALLSYLEKELIDSKYDLKHLYRIILTSQTYQLSSVAHSDDPQAAACFASYPLRRLEAEVLIDAINKITGTTDLYTSAIPEPFTYIPQDMPAVAVADGSITSPFLALFGRSARATGMENERNNDLTSAQWLHLLNSSHVQTKLERGPNMRQLLTSRSKPVEIVEELYLTVLSRYPTPDELQRLAEFGGGKAARRDQWIDVTWALLNSPEFLFRH